MQIRNFKPQDLETLVKFKGESIRVSFPGKSYNLDLFKSRLLKADPSTILVAEDQGRIAGYCWFRIKTSNRISDWFDDF